MRRTLAIITFIAGIHIAALPLHAQGVDPASEHYVEVFLGLRKAEDQEKAGDVKAAIASYSTALVTLKQIKKESPDWQTALIDHRIKTTNDSIARLREKMGDTMKPGVGDPGVLPPLDPSDPLTPPPAVIPGGKATKPAPLIGGKNPIEEVQQQIEDLRRRAEDAERRFREEQERNAKLTKDIAAAIDARTKAEKARKDAQILSDEYQKSFLKLKSEGNENGERAKELEAQIAEAKRAAVSTQAELDAAGERISQLLDRSHIMQTKANEAGTLPAQVKSLQAKLKAEQEATAQQSEQAKKREEDLRTQIATLAKDKKDSAGAVAEMKALQAKLDAEVKTSASEALKAKQREENLQKQLATIRGERDDARAELVRLREANKEAAKLMADNSSLLKKLGEAEAKILDFKSTGSARDTELAALRKQITETQKALDSSGKKNETLQAEISELQRRVTDYSKQIDKFKADKSASAEERKKMEDENRLLQGIVTRVLQEDANRAQRSKMIQSEVSKLHIHSDVLLQQINYLTQPVVKLTATERKLFKKPILDVQDVHTLVAFKPPEETPAVPAATDATKPASDGATPPVPTTQEPAPAPKPPEPPKTDSTKPKPGDDLPQKDPVAPKSSQDSTTPPVSSNGAADSKLPPEVKPIAEQAKLAFEREKFPDAEKLYDKALQMAPNNVYLLSNDAVVKFRMGKFKQAEETLNKALAIAPEDAFCWSLSGIVLYSEEKYDEAVTALTKSLAINPKNPTAHNYLGITAAQKGWLEAAQKELESAVALDPKYADAWFNLAVTYTTKKPPELEAARKAYKTAVELGSPKDEKMEELLNK